MYKLVDSENPECTDPKTKAQGNTPGRKLAPGGKGLQRDNKEVQGRGWSVWVSYRCPPSC